jgi:hypothetical protein
MPSVDEINNLGNDLKKLWREGDAIRPWLRKHADMLIGLVHDDWSWAGVAAALSHAGITYRTGRAWQPEQLRVHIAAAKTPLKSTLRRQENTTGIKEAATVTILSPREPREASAHNENTPKFKAFSLKAPEPPRPVTSTENAERDALQTRLFGK